MSAPDLPYMSQFGQVCIQRVQEPEVRRLAVTEISEVGCLLPASERAGCDFGSDDLDLPAREHEEKFTGGDINDRRNKLGTEDICARGAAQHTGDANGCEALQI